MLSRMPAPVLAGLIALAASNVAAQTAGPPAAAPPAAQPTASGRYQSAFEGYQSYGDAQLLPWKESNDTVGKIGGWRVYAREAQGAQPSPASGAAGATRPADAVVPAADPHSGHGKR